MNPDPRKYNSRNYTARPLAPVIVSLKAVVDKGRSDGGALPGGLWHRPGDLQARPLRRVERVLIPDKRRDTSTLFRPPMCQGLTSSTSLQCPLPFADHSPPGPISTPLEQQKHETTAQPQWLMMRIILDDGPMRQNKRARVVIEQRLVPIGNGGDILSSQTLFRDVAALVSVVEAASIDVIAHLDVTRRGGRE